jgi:hypothetical protein
VTEISWHRQRMLCMVAILCCAGLIAGVIWSSDRGLELTDEAYYILSAIHPEQVQLYISAQHWVLAPLWAITENLQGFRLTGAALLLGAAVLLALGATRCLALLTGTRPAVFTYLGVAAAGGVGALLYVVTIAPSPSYNLLASAGAYGAAGCALLAVDQRRKVACGALCAVAGGWLALCLLSKPSSGVCVGLTVLALVLCLQPGRRKWLMVASGGLGAFGTLGLFVLAQPSVPAVYESLRGGLELFRMVQTEPVAARLAHYIGTVSLSTGQALLSFAPAVILTAALMRYPRLWLAWSMLFLALCIIIIGKYYLGGMTRYESIANVIYALLILTISLGFRTWISHPKIRLLFAGLLILPFSSTIGTGNSLFTQVIVALAPWTILATLLCQIASQNAVIRLAQVGTTLLLLMVIPVQVITSFTREPYHLNAPLTAQSEVAVVGRLGLLKIDPATRQFLTEMETLRTVCAIRPGAFFLGLFNLPGLALVLDAVPPVTPWLNNADQAATVLSHWTPDPASQVIFALTPEVQADPSALPQVLQPDTQNSTYCGSAIFPYESKKVDFWLSSDPAD